MKKHKYHRLILLILCVVIFLFGCTESTPDNPKLNNNEINNPGMGFIYPRAPAQWNNYISLFQKDAVSVASRPENFPDDNSITYLRSYAGINSGDEHLGYVWRWIKNNQEMIFISGMINESGITNLLLNNSNNLSIDEIILSFTSDDEHQLLGQYKVDYNTNIWSDYTTESKQNLNTTKNYPTINENQTIDLSTYSDSINCQEIYWLNGVKRGAQSNNFKTLLDDLKLSISEHNLETFKIQLPKTLNMECSYYFQEQLYADIFNYESELINKNSTSKKIFLQHMLSSGTTPQFGENNFCDTVNLSLVKSQNNPAKFESIELAEIFLNYTDTKKLNCSLAGAIRSVAQLNQTTFLNRLVTIETSNSLSDIKAELDNTFVIALESAFEANNFEAGELLANRLSKKLISIYQTQQLLIAAGKSANIKILDLLLTLNISIDFSRYHVLEQALVTGNSEIVEKLFNIGFTLPSTSHALESLMWSTYKYNTAYNNKNQIQLFEILKKNGLNFSNIEKRDQFILLSRVYTFAHAAWVDIHKKNTSYESAKIYKKSIIELTQLYLKHTKSIDYQHGREQHTLLMQAVEGNLPDIVEIILSQHPNLGLKNNRGKTALDIATQEARIYILGSRKGFDKIYKLNAKKIVSLLGGDITPFSTNIE